MQVGLNTVMSFWVKPRQVVVMDALSGKKARNFYVRPLSIALLVLSLTTTPFVIGAWYAPFHSVQEIIPQNLKLTRQNLALTRLLADANTLNDLKDEELISLEDDIHRQEDNIRGLSKQVRMFNSLLEARKGAGVQLLQTQAQWVSGKQIDWQSVLVKGGSLPRFLLGRYQLVAIGEDGQRLELKAKKMSYRFETHVFLKHTFAWSETWRPNNIEFTVLNRSRKKVLTELTPILGE